jgi:hypothetical protein
MGGKRDMVKRTVALQKTLTREVLVKELRASERRIDTRFDVRTESLKEYIDSRISQVNHRIDKFEKKDDARVHVADERSDSVDGKLSNIEKRFRDIDVRFDGMDGRFDGMDKRFDSIDVRFDKLHHKLEISIHGLVELIERRSGEIVGVEGQLDNHEQRIKVLETKH